MSDIPTSLEITEVRELLDTYVDGGIDDEELIDRLAQMRDLASDEATDTLAAELSELVARIEMIHLNICRAERRHAIAGVIEDFNKLDPGAVG